MNKFIKLVMVGGCILLFGCEEQATTHQEPVRGLKTVTIEDTANLSVRRYPSVLHSSDTTILSFAIGGRLGKNSLEVGQRVKRGEALVELDRRSLELSVESARAALEQAKATAANANRDLKRQEKLFEQKIVSQAKLENARTTDKTSQAQVVQARKQLETAQENLEKSTLTAPYDGIINSVSADSFATISPGEAIATLYNPNSFEARFTVSYDIVSRLTVGKPVVVRLADKRNVSLKGNISELASSTDTVSSYPVVVKLAETDPNLKSGMAIEVVLEMTLSEEVGHALPVSALIVEGDWDLGDDPTKSIDGEVYIYDEDTQTVKRTTVTVIGLRENQIIVSDGLNRGDRVAVAGVAFLREGQKVKLLNTKASGDL